MLRKEELVEMLKKEAEKIQKISDKHGRWMRRLEKLGLPCIILSLILFILFAVRFLFG